MLKVKINLTKILPPFLLTFFVAVAVVSLAGYFGFGKFSANSYDLENKQKIYAVLVKEAQIKQDRVNKNRENSKGKIFTPPDRAVSIKGWFELAKATNEIDTRQLPDEFKLAWRKYANALTKSAEAFSNLPEPFQFNIDSDEAQNWKNAVSDQIEAWSEVVSIAKSYGIKFDQYENLIIN